jgi:hypothetical protein
MKTERKFLSLLLAITTIFYLAFIIGTSFVVNNERFFTLVDDAMISINQITAQHTTTKPLCVSYTLIPPKIYNLTIRTWY